MPKYQTIDQRVLLIHPLGYAAQESERDILRLTNTMPPLGLASVGAWLEKHGVDVDIVDCFAMPRPDHRIQALLHERPPAFVGLTCTTHSYPDAVRIARLVKAVNPEIKTVIGGPHASGMGKIILNHEAAIDFIVVGEGESPMLELVQREGRDLAEVKGLCFRDTSGQAVFTGLQTKLLELDSLPFPAYHKLPGYPGTYTLPLFNYPRTPNASCVASRGCPYQCSYCDRSVFRRTFRCNSAEYLYQHLQYLHQRWGIRHVNFYDDQFTLQRERVEKFCRLMLDQPLGVSFNCAVRAEHVDLPLLKLMKAAGCWMVSLGIETGDPELLARHRQNSDLEMLAEKVRDIKRAGIRTKALMMIGLPGENEQTFQNTMKYLFSLPVDDVNLAKFTPFPGSPLYQEIHRFGQFEENFEKMDCMNFVFIPEGMTRARLDQLFAKFYRRHFMRPRTLWGYLTMIWRSPDSWRRFWKYAGSYLAFARSNQRIRKTKPSKL